MADRESDALLQEVADIDPNAARCPWCDGILGKRVWKGQHAAKQHPEEWEAFKNYYVKNTTASVTWEET